MIIERVLRWRWLRVIGIVVIVLSGCTLTRTPEESLLDPRFAGPCNRLVLAWPIDMAIAQKRLGPTLRPRSTNSHSTLEVHVVACAGSGSRQPPLEYAYTAIAIDAASAPVVVTTVPEDKWWAMTQMWADAPSTAVLATMDYAVEPAKVTLNVSGEDRKASVQAAIVTPSGRLTLSAHAAGGPVTTTDQLALVTDSDDAVTLFFGEESGARVVLNVDTVSDKGLLNLVAATKSPRAVLDQKLISNRMFWRRSKP